MRDYGFFDQLIHRLVLSGRPVREMMFDAETAIFRKVVNDAPINNVFISGLARSGTTALLNGLFQSNVFASLTYRDMPFVLAPNLWNSLSRSKKRNATLRERAHKDGVMINVQSPEAFEEVFWSLFDQTDVGAGSSLKVHEIPSDACAEFETFMALVCHRYAKLRYLSKNNDNIFRLGSLAQLLDESTFLVPFRDPHVQAASLYRQHLRFCKSDPFEADYMRWIGHHEFGINHKPHHFTGLETSRLRPETPDYWLELWIDAYSYLRDVIAAHPNVHGVCYELMAEDNPSYITSLGEVCGVNLSPEDFRPNISAHGCVFDDEGSARARGLYLDLKGLGLA